MKIRAYHPGEEVQLWQLFFNSIHNVSAQHYTKEQLHAWAPKDMHMDSWCKKTQKISPFVCELQGIIMGYSDLQKDGYIEHFFCHYQYQRQGVGSALMQHINHQAKVQNIQILSAEVSITAKPFFESKGFKVIEQQKVVVRGQELTNYRMQKALGC